MRFSRPAEFSFSFKSIFIDTDFDPSQPRASHCMRPCSTSARAPQPCVSLGIGRVDGLCSFSFKAVKSFRHTMMKIENKGPRHGSVKSMHIKRKLLFLLPQFQSRDASNISKPRVSRPYIYSQHRVCFLSLNVVMRYIDQAKIKQVFSLGQPSSGQACIACCFSASFRQGTQRLTSLEEFKRKSSTISFQ